MSYKDQANLNDIYDNSHFLEQLVYAETFMPEFNNAGNAPNSSNSSNSNSSSHVNKEDDLLMFMDNSFVFTNEEKGKLDNFDDDDDKHNNNDNSDNSNNSNNNFSVPKNAKNSLEKAGLSKEQILLLGNLVNKYDKNSLNINGTVSDNISGEGNLDTRSSSRSSSVVSSGRVSKNGVDMDKRKRNTEASARFRIKKKLKEQKLENDVKELRELAASLELKIKNLSMENALLKNLVVEKNVRKSNEEVEKMKQRALQNFGTEM